MKEISTHLFDKHTKQNKKESSNDIGRISNEKLTMTIDEQGSLNAASKETPNKGPAIAAAHRHQLRKTFHPLSCHPTRAETVRFKNDFGYRSVCLVDRV